MRERQPLYRTVFILGLTLALTVCSLSSAETLARLESITARYPSLSAFLNDQNAVREYRDVLKLYMGEGPSFDPVYDEFIRQIKEVNTNVQGFGEQAWGVNANWQAEGFKILGEHSGSGLEIKREAVFSAVEKIKTETGQVASTLIRDRAQIPKLVAELRATYGLLPENEVEKLSRKQFNQYQSRLGGDKAAGIPKFAEHPASRMLAAYAAHEILEHDERLTDALYSGDADILANALKKLSRLSGAKEFFATHRIEVPNEVLAYLAYNSPTSGDILEQYERGLRSTKDFRHIADARIDPALLARMQQLQADGVEEAQIPNHLSTEEQGKLREWRSKASFVREEKKSFAKSHNTQNVFFSYELYEDPARGNLRLKADTGTELNFIPSPRPFHAFFAGRKTQECVGGRDCGGLTPKRWARAALKGAVNLFTETGDGKMEGMVGLTRLIHKGEDQVPTAYDVVDLMSRAIKGDVIVRDDSGRPVKYSFFDFFVDRYSRKAGSHGLVISDGNSVSQNIGGGEVVNHSPAYLENQIVGKPNQFTPFDPMADAIAKEFPGTMHGYGQGGMIYDGMKGDGTKVVRLVPTRERKKWTKEELEDVIMDEILVDSKPTDKDPVWKRARESGVRLESVKYYEGQIDLTDSPLLNRALARIKDHVVNNAGNEELRKEAADTLKQALQKHPRSPQMLFLVKDLLSNHVGTAATEIAASALAATIKDHPTENELIKPDIIAGLRKSLAGYENINGEEGMQPLLREVYAAHHNSPEIHSLFKEMISDAPGTNRSVLATYAVLQAIKTHPNEKGLVSSELVSWLRNNIVNHQTHPQTAEAAMNTITGAITVHPKSPELVGLIREMLSDHAGTRLASGAAYALGRAIDDNPKETSLIGQDIINILRKNIIKKKGEGYDANTLWTLDTAIEKHPADKSIRTPDIMGDLARVLADDPGSYAAWAAVHAVRRVFEANPKDNSLITPAMIAGLTKNLLLPTKGNPNTRDTSRDLLRKALEFQPARTLLLADAELLNYIERSTDIRKKAVETLFLPEHRADLIRVVRSGSVPFVNQALAEMALPDIPNEILRMQDSREARKALAASKNREGECERIFQLLYLQYGRYSR